MDSFTGYFVSVYVCFGGIVEECFVFVCLFEGLVVNGCVVVGVLCIVFVRFAVFVVEEWHDFVLRVGFWVEIVSIEVAVIS